jgi:multiple sugar transport system substrate-binding protein
MSQLSRRTVVKGMAAAGAVAAFPAIAACGGDDDDDAASSSGGGKKAVGTVTLGSNQSDPIPKKAVADVMAAFE